MGVFAVGIGLSVPCHLHADFLWNIGVTVGVCSILMGYGTSIPFLDFPAGIWILLLVSYCIVAGYLVMMFKSRRDGHVYITQWYILAACFWSWIRGPNPKLPASNPDPSGRLHGSPTANEL